MWGWVLNGYHFYFNGEKQSIDVLSFWQWSSSELLGNTLRGVLAEFIVASTIDGVDKPRDEWDPYDLETKNGLKIEVKSSSYFQSWQQKRKSTINFGIQPTEDEYSGSGIKERRADLYVFCVLAYEEDDGKVNPLDLSQWDFYVLETKVLNEKVPTQKSIGLKSLQKLNPVKVQYDKLGEEINKYEK